MYEADSNSQLSSLNKVEKELEKIVDSIKSMKSLTHEARTNHSANNDQNESPQESNPSYDINEFIDKDFYEMQYAPLHH